MFAPPLNICWVHFIGFRVYCNVLSRLNWWRMGKGGISESLAPASAPAHAMLPCSHLNSVLVTALGSTSPPCHLPYAKSTVPQANRRGHPTTACLERQGHKYADGCRVVSFMLPLRCRGGVIFLVVPRCTATATLPTHSLYVDLARVNSRCSNELQWGMEFCVPTVILVSASVTGAHYPNPTSNRDFKLCPNQSPALPGVSWGCCALKHLRRCTSPDCVLAYADRMSRRSI